MIEVLYIYFFMVSFIKWSRRDNRVVGYVICMLGMYVYVRSV